MRRFNYLDTILFPAITEKATFLSEYNKIVFKVHDGATKKSIKKSVEKLFKVNVIKVNTINQKGKIKIGDEIDLEMSLKMKQLDKTHIIQGKIKIY